MLTYSIYDTPLGKMLIAADEIGIVHLYPAQKVDTQGMEQGETPLLRQAAQKLEAYLKGEGDTLSDLPLSPRGTPFQKQVWRALRTVPMGKPAVCLWPKPWQVRQPGGGGSTENTILLVYLSPHCGSGWLSVGFTQMNENIAPAPRACRIKRRLFAG